MTNGETVEGGEELAEEERGGWADGVVVDGGEAVDGESAWDGGIVWEELDGLIVFAVL